MVCIWCVFNMYVFFSNNFILFIIVAATPQSNPTKPLLISTPTHVNSPCSWNTLSVFQQMQSNTDHLINHQFEMQEMRKLVQFQQEQYKLTIGFLSGNK